MIESDFLQLTEKTFEEAEAFADANYPNSDSYREGNVLTIELEDGPSVVINAGDVACGSKRRFPFQT